MTARAELIEPTMYALWLLSAHDHGIGPCEPRNVYAIVAAEPLVSDEDLTLRDGRTVIAKHVQWIIHELVNQGLIQYMSGGWLATWELIEELMRRGRITPEQVRHRIAQCVARREAHLALRGGFFPVPELVRQGCALADQSAHERDHLSQEN